MCGRYYVDESIRQAVAKLMHTTAGVNMQEWPAADIRPTDAAPVIIAAEGGLRLEYQHWGYPGFRGGQTIFNARAESVLEKKMFQNGILHHRIAVPCTRFYEWNKEKEKIEFDREDSPVLYMAGFSDSFPDGDRFIVLTTAANASMVRTHDRMPLVLEAGELRDWITDDGKTEDFLGRVPVLLRKHAEYEQETLF